MLQLQAASEGTPVLHSSCTAGSLSPMSLFMLPFPLSCPDVYLYGTCPLCSTRAVMTRPSVSRDWLIEPASRARPSLAPDLQCHDMMRCHILSETVLCLSVVDAPGCCNQGHLCCNLVAACTRLKALRQCCFGPGNWFNRKTVLCTLRCSHCQPDPPGSASQS
jgi:hypothetical protein